MLRGRLAVLAAAHAWCRGSVRVRVRRIRVLHGSFRVRHGDVDRLGFRS